jgi:RimJ/RimL family protein N-acetyltransferase
MIKIKEKIIGNQIYLRHLTLDDASSEYRNWLNDKEVNRYLDNKYRNGARATIKELKEYIGERNKDQNCLLLGIFYKKNKKHIGNIKLAPIEPDGKKATIGVLIGDKDYWGMGIATEAIKLLIDYAHKELNILEFNLGVLPQNKPAIRVYEKNGFKSDHIKRKSVRYGNKLYDNLIMVLKFN